MIWTFEPHFESTLAYAGCSFQYCFVSEMTMLGPYYEETHWNEHAVGNQNTNRYKKMHEYLSTASHWIDYADYVWARVDFCSNLSLCFEN